MALELASAVAGAGGGVVALLATYPLLTVTTVQQTALAKLAKGEKAPKSMQVARELVAANGVGSLYNGVAPALVGTAASQAVYYSCYSRLRRAMATRNAQGVAELGVASTTLVASMAGCVNVLLTNPIWVVVTIMQAQRKAAGSTTNKPATLREVLRDLYADNGAMAFFKGLVPSLVMVSNPTIQYVLYESLVNLRARLLSPKPPAKSALSKPTPLEVFGMGIAAKFGATLVTYPLLVVKSRLQSTTGASKKDDDAPRYRSTLEALLRIPREEGVGALYRGMETKLVQTLTAAGLLFMVKDVLEARARALVLPPKRAA